MSKPRKHTARQLLNQFQFAQANQNYLIDMACPQCGNREAFAVAVETFARLSDDGTDTQAGDWDTEYTPNSYCRCDNDKCGDKHGPAGFLIGRVRDFTFPGLDALIEQCNCVTVHSWHGEGHCSACPCAIR